MEENKEKGKMHLITLRVWLCVCEYVPLTMTINTLSLVYALDLYFEQKAETQMALALKREALSVYPIRLE